MLIEFSAANFRSIHSRQTLSLVASPDKSHAQRNIAAAHDKQPRLVRSAVIYGANAAGKSNLLRAVGFAQFLVLQSATALQEGQRLPVTPFALSRNWANPSARSRLLLPAALAP